MKSVKSATDQHQALRALWPEWRTIATSTGRTDQRQAEQAIKRLYHYYHYAEPTIRWLNSLSRLPIEYIGTPIFCHFRETLIYSIWHRLSQPGWVCTQIGYNPHDGTFTLPLNKRLLNSRTFISPRRPGRRPPWLTDASNMISQFDVDVLALQQLATESAIEVEAGVHELADIVAEIARTCFAAVVFEETCLLIRKPTTVVLNEAQQLSAQGAVAFEAVYSALDAKPFRVYAANGRIISVNAAPEITYESLHWCSVPSRVALIEYMGWEHFLKLMVQRDCATQLSSDRFGKLFLIRCAQQEFLVVDVQNKTREPNGKYRHYVIPVDRECRPLPNPTDPRTRIGAPQSLTPLNAVGSLFGMTGPQYAAILGRES